MPRSDRPVQAKLRCKHHRRYQGRFHPSCKPRPLLPHCGGAAVRTRATVGHSFCVEYPCCVGGPCATGAALRRGDDRPCLLRRSADRPTHCRELGADRIQVREWLPGGGGHRRTASATATARAENGTCQRTRIVDDTCPAPRDPMVPPALPDRSKSPPRSPPSACRLLSKPIPYSPPCLRENWMLPRRDRLHITSLILPWVEPPRPIVVRVDEVGRAREVAAGELVVDPGAHTQRVRPVDPLLPQPVAGVGAGQ